MSTTRQALSHYVGVAAEAIIIRMEEGAIIEFDGAQFHLRNKNNVRVENISRDVIEEVKKRRRFLPNNLNS